MSGQDKAASKGTRRKSAITREMQEVDFPPDTKLRSSVARPSAAPFSQPPTEEAAALMSEFDGDWKSRSKPTLREFVKAYPVGVTSTVLVFASIAYGLSLPGSMQIKKNNAMRARIAFQGIAIFCFVSDQIFPGLAKYSLFGQRRTKAFPTVDEFGNMKA